MVVFRGAPGEIAATVVVPGPWPGLDLFPVNMVVVV